MIALNLHEKLSNLALREFARAGIGPSDVHEEADSFAYAARELFADRIADALATRRNAA